MVRFANMKAEDGDRKFAKIDKKMSKIYKKGFQL